MVLLPDFASGAANRPPDTGPKPDAKPDILLVVVDTLRADHLGLYGYSRDTSPKLDALAKSAVVFDRGRSQAACTYASVASLFTGRYPEIIHRKNQTRRNLPESLPTLAELLRREGYTTLGVSASLVVRNTPAKFNPDGGFGRGFDTFDESCAKKPARCVTNRAIELLEDAKSPVFLYLHYMDPHAPYDPPTDHVRKFSVRTDRQPGNGDLRPWARRLYKKGRPVSEAVVSTLMDAYDDEILYWDGQFGRLMDLLAARRPPRESIVVLTSDHGEDFLEHEDLGHCRSVHESSTHIPLLFWLPGDPGGRRVAAPAENVALLPTLLDLVGVENLPPNLDAASIRPLLLGKPTGNERAYAAQGHARSANDARYKLVYDYETQESQLYDLELDPAEKRDRKEKAPLAYLRLHGELSAHLEAIEGITPRAASLKRQKLILNNLRALGYIE